VCPARGACPDTDEATGCITHNLKLDAEVLLPVDILISGPSRLEDGDVGAIDSSHHLRDALADSGPLPDAPFILKRISL
jgi:hypothetical protein